MNKTEARFCTSSEGIAAYLLWNSVYPDKWAEMANGPALLYFKDRDYSGIMLRYWKGLSIPICEFNECVVAIRRIFKTGEIDPDELLEMWDEIYDIRADYNNHGQLDLLGSDE